MEDWVGKACGIMRINKITQKDIANYLGVTSNYISTIMTGKRNPKEMQTKIFSALEELRKRKD